ncbi:hypothetical protein [Pedobacter agri]|uniref:Uncharacterized protein n=1 Tax=Pedobacter agri TaxID=454586 RepID=A0A9X3IBF8_9SPHI|nr:hypothetical protein [Pedobacter agri]MCX3266548.1 hypothetical protein [Pedobacter agri]
MKQKLIALLKTSFASKGFNAKELESLADLIISQQSLTDESTDEDLSTAVTAAKPTADFVQSVASRQVSDVKKPAKVEEPAKKEDPAEPATPTDMPEWAKGLLTSVGALTQGLAAIQSEKVGNTRREQYAKTLEGTSEAFKTKALKDFDRMAFKDDEDFNSYLADATEDAKIFIQEDANGGMGNDRPVGGIGGSTKKVKEATDTELDAVMENL